MNNLDSECQGGWINERTQYLSIQLVKGGLACNTESLLNFLKTFSSLRTLSLRYIFTKGKVKVELEKLENLYLSFCEFDELNLEEGMPSIEQIVLYKARIDTLKQNPKEAIIVKSQVRNMEASEWEINFKSY